MGKHTSSVKHKPTSASTISRPRWVVTRLIEKQPGTYGLPTRDITIKDTFPAVCDVRGFSLEPGLPFFGAILGRAQERGCRREGKHVDAVDVLDYVAKVSGVIRLVFKVLFIMAELAPQVIASGKYVQHVTYNPAAFITREFRRMSVIPTHHIKVFVKCAFHLCHHQSCSPFHCWILGQPAPKFHRKAKVHIFGRRLLILSVTRLEKTFRPGMTMEYVKRSHAREIFVVLVRVGNLLFVRIYLETMDLSEE